jgi:hypothetical protein
MILRCFDPTSKSFRNYGGRGIKVCEDWLSFEKFLLDMGPPPKGCELDRVDNDGDYEKENCRWATRVQNANNKTTSVVIEYDGLALTVQQWSRKLGVARELIRDRIFKLGWSVDRALSTPPRRVRR